MKKLVSVTLALILALALLTASAEGVLKVGMECDYVPFNWLQVEENEYTAPVVSGGYADGFDVQIAKIIADGLDMELQVVQSEFDSLPLGVNAGAFDMIIAGMTPTEARKLTVDFSDAYYISDVVIIVRKDGDFANATSLADFSGAKLTGQRATVHYDMLNEVPDAKVMQSMETFPEMTVALQAGAIDGYIAERPTALAVTTTNEDLAFITFEEGSGFSATAAELSVAVGLQKGSELTERVNEILAGITLEQRDQIMLDSINRTPVSE